jgi:hypothetical protein
MRLNIYTSAVMALKIMASSGNAGLHRLSGVLMHRAAWAGLDPAVPAHVGQALEGVLDEIVGPGRVVGQGTSIAPQPRDFSFEKSTEIVHLTLQCSRQIAGRVWRVSVKGTGVISITVKPNRSRISLSAAFCD